MDPREEKLAEIFTSHSLTIKEGDFIGLRFGMEAKDLALACYKKILEKGAFPIIKVLVDGFDYVFYKTASDKQLKMIPETAKVEAKMLAGIITIGADQNNKELSSIDPKKIQERSKLTSPIYDELINKDNWMYFEYPTHALAQEAGMPTEEFKDLIFSASLIDWNEQLELQKKLKAIYDQGKNMRIIGENTNLTFSIEDRQAIMCYGKRNMPDGEVYIAPIETTTKGTIEFSYPFYYAGRAVSGVKLTFENGVVTSASAKENEDLLLELLSTDEGAKRLGEFSIATNPILKTSLKKVLFDEKIGGTIHLALGRAYKKGNGKNESNIHVDIVKDLRKQGEVWIDETLVLKNGVLQL